jgi:hypothetical protein
MHNQGRRLRIHCKLRVCNRCKRALPDQLAQEQGDTVVVYKIDQLTRSLADFAKIVEILDAKGASFVSVTQQFNTTTSMGRLTLKRSAVLCKVEWDLPAR